MVSNQTVLSHGASQITAYRDRNISTVISITSVKLVSELWEITFSTGKPKLTQAEVQTFQGF